jgi:hypothetical protein
VAADFLGANVYKLIPRNDKCICFGVEYDYKQKKKNLLATEGRSP